MAMCKEPGLAADAFGGDIEYIQVGAYLISCIIDGSNSYSRDILRRRSYTLFSGGTGGREPLSKVMGTKRRNKYIYSCNLLNI